MRHVGMVPDVDFSTWRDDALQQTRQALTGRVLSTYPEDVRDSTLQFISDIMTEEARRALNESNQEVTVESVRQALAGDASFSVADVEQIPDAWIISFVNRKPTKQEVNADLLEDLRRELTEAMRLAQCEHDRDFEAMLRSILLDLEILAMKYNCILKFFTSRVETDQ